MIDDLSLLYSYLSTHPTITGTFGTRVWAGVQAPPSDHGYKPADGPALVFVPRGGSGFWNSDRSTYVGRYLFWVIGTDPYTVQQAFRDLVESLDRAATRNILVAELSGGGDLLPFPETSWPSMLSYFNVEFTEV